mgnify:CR=1 FL=1
MRTSFNACMAMLLLPALAAAQSASAPLTERLSLDTAVKLALDTEGVHKVICTLQVVPPAKQVSL